MKAAYQCPRRSQMGTGCYTAATSVGGALETQHHDLTDRGGRPNGRWHRRLWTGRTETISSKPNWVIGVKVLPTPRLQTDVTTGRDEDVPQQTRWFATVTREDRLSWLRRMLLMARPGGLGHQRLPDEDSTDSPAYHSNSMA